MPSLEQRFQTDATVLLSASTVSTSPEQSINQLWDELRGYYSEDKRAYHNLQHLENLFTLFDEYQDQLNDPTVVVWAIWYHDIIYNAKRKNNELRSAELAQQRLVQLEMPEEQIKQVVSYIEATAQHLSVEATGDLAYFLDFDLAILGSDRETYSTYAQAVRQEYRHVLGFLYRRGRRRVLRYFMEAPQLFRTPQLKARFEEVARKNMSWELKSGLR